MLLVVPHIDPLVQEQLLFAERVKREMGEPRPGEDREGSAVAVDVLYVEHPRAFHGYLNCKYTRSLKVVAERRLLTGNSAGVDRGPATA